MFLPLRAAAVTAALLLSTAAQAGDFTLTSPDLVEGRPMAERQVFNGFGCAGGNQAPSLAWTGVPEGTRSLAVTAYDPDAPTGSGWWHWVVFNLPAETRGLPSGVALPVEAVESRTDFGSPGYGGPCPPQGDGPHRYIFTVHALKVAALPLNADASAAMVGFFLNGNSLGKATLTATYER